MFDTVNELLRIQDALIGLITSIVESDESDISVASSLGVKSDEITAIRQNARQIWQLPLRRRMNDVASATILTAIRQAAKLLPVTAYGPVTPPLRPHRPG